MSNIYIFKYDAFDYVEFVCRAEFNLRHEYFLFYVILDRYAVKSYFVIHHCRFGILEEDFISLLTYYVLVVFVSY